MTVVPVQKCLFFGHGKCGANPHKHRLIHRFRLMAKGAANKGVAPVETVRNCCALVVDKLGKHRQSAARRGKFSTICTKLCTERLVHANRNEGH
jgi:hypothetical protein